MLLKTIQPISILEQVYENNERIYSYAKTKKDTYWSFFESYKWLKERKMHNIGIKSHTDQLLWAWEYDSPRNIKYANEMIGHQIANFPHDCVALTFYKNEDDVLLSDHSYWEYVLNYWAIPKNKKDAIFWESLESGEHTNFYEEKPLQSQYHHQLIENSWEQAFMIEKDSKKKDYIFSLPDETLKHMGIKKEDCLIQATFWDILRIDIQKIEIIKA